MSIQYQHIRPFEMICFERYLNDDGKFTLMQCFVIPSHRLTISFSNTKNSQHTITLTNTVMSFLSDQIFIPFNFVLIYFCNVFIFKISTVGLFRPALLTKVKSCKSKSRYRVEQVKNKGGLVEEEPSI